MNNILVICGPTATGKTDLAIGLAKKFNGELVSADSRQVYIGMDIGTGKDLPENSELRIMNWGIKEKKLHVGFREKEGIPVWLVDICQPNYIFNVGEYQKIARLVINDIYRRGKLPIIVGGTGLYIKSILEPFKNMQIPPNTKLRQQLNNFSVKELQNKLNKLNKTKFISMNHSDQNNPRRLIRAIEIEEFNMSSRVSSLSSRAEARDPANEMSVTNNGFRNDNSISPLLKGESLIIGLNSDKTLLQQKIKKRVDQRLSTGILEEIQKLLDLGFDWNMTSMSGMGYREWRKFFENSKNLVHSSKFIVHSNKEVMNEIIELWKLHETQYAKKQMTFFKKMPNIQWFDINDSNYPKSILSLVNNWYNKIT